MSPVRFAIVGRGWRARFFTRLAEVLPDRFAVTQSLGRDDELTGRPDFVVVSVPWPVTPVQIVRYVERGVPVLAETPPAPDAEGLCDLWSTVGASGLVQVAEQYLLMPGHAARLALARAGVLGTVTSAQVSSTHLYHAVSIMRGLLGVHHERATVRAHPFTAPLVDPLTPAGWTGDGTERDARTTIATLDFGGGRSGLYDFTDNQWWNPLRGDRIVVRGSRGELVDDRVTRLVDPTTPVREELVRRHTGRELNLEGFDLDHVSFGGTVVYRNPYRGARLSDEEIAIATMLDRTAAWCRGEGEPPYPLADGCQDHWLGLAIEDAARRGTAVTTGPGPWTEG
jgi:predicted dehydrogenase